MKLVSFPRSNLLRPRPGVMIVSRQSDPSSMSSTNKGVIIFAVIVGFFLCGGLILAFVLRYLRGRHANPKYLPGSYLKSKWRSWMPSSEKKKYASTLQDRRSIHARTPTPSPSIMGFSAPNNTGDVGRGNDNENQAPDRHLSVRSTITLPAYSASARPTEQILGREGERAGIDTVVEFPETTIEEDERRNDEMESLYQIRRARREERAEREQRRQQRRDARQRNDHATIEALRLAQLDSNDRPSAALIEAHQNRDRGRRISSVNYMAVGVARHDGSRLRAHSEDSNRSLLGGAGQIAGSSDPSLHLTPHSTLGSNFGNGSSSSLRFMTADYSDDDGGSDMEGSGTPGRCRTPSQPMLLRTESGAILARQPPQYHDLVRQPERVASARPGDRPPSYASPRSSRHGPPQLPPLANVPSIEVTPTPWSPVRST